MRALGFWGLAGAIALLPMTASGAADSSAAKGGAGSSMTTGTPPAPASGGAGWGNVPNAPLHPPAAQPGSWGPSGWNGGPGRPAAPGNPGNPGELPAGGPVTPPPLAGMPGPDHAGGPGRPGGWGNGADRGGYNGGGYRGGGYRGAPGRYTHFGRGQRLPRAFLAPNLFVQDWWSYGLGRPGYGQGWIRYYDDALLVDDSGRVLDSRYGLDWDRRGAAPYDDDDGYEPGNYDHGWHRDHGGPDGPIVARPGAPVVVHHGGGWGGGETTVVVVQGAPTVTTTTTTTYEDVVVHRGGGHKVWRPKSKLRCRCN